MIKKYLPYILTACFFLLLVGESDAQRKSSRTSREGRESTRSSRVQEPELSFSDNLTYGIYIGNVGLGNGFSFSGKGDVGYKITDRLALGVGVKWEYAFINQQDPNPDFSLFNYGAYAFPRFKITDDIYLKGEYNFFSRQNGFGGNGDRINSTFPLLGGGYSSGFGKWKFGFEVLFALTNEGRDNYTFIEYTFNFLYNL